MNKTTRVPPQPARAGTAPQDAAQSAGSTAFFEQLRRIEYARLDQGRQVYLDYTGAGLYAQSQLAEHFELLTLERLREPSFRQPYVSAATELVEQARAQYFRSSAPTRRSTS